MTQASTRDTRDSQPSPAGCPRRRCCWGTRTGRGACGTAPVSACGAGVVVVAAARVWGVVVRLFPGLHSPPAGGARRATVRTRTPHRTTPRTHLQADGFDAQQAQALKQALAQPRLRRALAHDDRRQLAVVADQDHLRRAWSWVCSVVRRRGCTRPKQRTCMAASTDRGAHPTPPHPTPPHPTPPHPTTLATSLPLSCARTCLAPSTRGMSASGSLACVHSSTSTCWKRSDARRMSPAPTHVAHTCARSGPGWALVVAGCELTAARAAWCCAWKRAHLHVQRRQTCP
jgi:hypothetical protein